MPSVNSRSMPKVLLSSTLMTPSLPTFSMASAMTSPTPRSRAEMVATRAISSLPEISLLCFWIDGDGLVDGLFDAALDGHRVGAGGYHAQALAHDRLGEQRGGRRAVTGDVVGLGRDFLDELGAQVLEDVLELDLASDGHAVVGDRRGAELLVEHHVAALGAEGDLHGVGERVHTALERAPGFVVILEFLSQDSSASPLTSRLRPGSRWRAESAVRHRRRSCTRCPSTCRR